jgi:hypothetical protein
MLCASSIVAPIPNIVGVGDSIMFGALSSTTMLLQLLQLPKGSQYRQTNLGVDALNTSAILATAQALLPNYSFVVTQTPWVLVVEGGTNDPVQGLSAAQSWSNLQAIYALGFNLGASRVIANNVPKSTARDAGQNAIIATLNASIGSGSASYSSMVDLDTLLILPGDFVDGTHPNAQGDTKWAAGVEVFL